MLPIVFILVLGPRAGPERSAWKDLETRAHAYQSEIAPALSSGIVPLEGSDIHEPILGIPIEKDGKRVLMYEPSPRHDEDNWLRSPATFPLILYFTIVAFVFLFFARFDRAIAGLARATRTIALGDLETPAVISGNREVSILGKALETMRIQLKDARDRKSFLLMGLSHDFRTPITAIRGYIEALQDGMALSAEEEASFLGIMHQKTLLLEGMVSRWLDLVRLETGERYLAFAEAPIAAYFRTLSQQLAMDARIANRQFESDIRIADAAVCPIDSELLGRCFENLFYNAVRATSPGGRIGLRVRPIKNSVEIDFWDDGTGVPDDERALIWEPFFRGKGVESQGNGLGLAVVKSIMESHKWEIALIPSSVGALFQIRIPTVYELPAEIGVEDQGLRARDH
jgi:signal transduction histidine kinase